MLRVVLIALGFATATAGALAQSTRFKPTDCDEVVENCEETFLNTPDPERQKAIIQELKKQSDELNKMRSNAGVKSDGEALPMKDEVDPKKK